MCVFRVCVCVHFLRLCFLMAVLQSLHTHCAPVFGSTAGLQHCRELYTVTIAASAGSERLEIAQLASKAERACSTAIGVVCSGTT